MSDNLNKIMHVSWLDNTGSIATYYSVFIITTIFQVSAQTSSCKDGAGMLYLCRQDTR